MGVTKRVTMDITRSYLGIELGSTRIKAVLLDEGLTPAASGAFDWENRLVNGVWTYSLDEVRTGLQTCFAALAADVKAKYGVPLTTVRAAGVSAMMHGYLPIGKDGRQLCGFRTWRNTITGPAAAKLTELFGFNVPQRWSVAHLYQAILNGETHVADLARLTTLSGYVHEALTGEFVLGVDDASGMFPVDPASCDYDAVMLEKFGALTGIDLRTVLPRVLPAGVCAGTLTEAGARLLDPSGTLRPGIPFAPPEGDAGTGMVATNSVRVRTGNVSAGTSDFAMLVTDQPLGVHREIDVVTTPDGLNVAMVHCNNCTGDLNAWVGLFGEFASACGLTLSKGELFDKLFRAAAEGDPDCGGLLSFNYLSGEGVTDLDEGRPLFVRTPDARLTLANFMRTHLLSALATLKIGLDLLTETEHVAVDRLTCHGGYFKTPGVGQRMLSAAVGAPVTAMETAGEGGPYGMALLAAYCCREDRAESLPDWLDRVPFAGARSVTVMAEQAEIDGFRAFLERYTAALPVEREAVGRVKS